MRGLLQLEEMRLCCYTCGGITVADDAADALEDRAAWPDLPCPFTPGPDASDTRLLPHPVVSARPRSPSGLRVSRPRPAASRPRRIGLHYLPAGKLICYGVY